MTHPWQNFTYTSGNQTGQTDNLTGYPMAAEDVKNAVIVRRLREELYNWRLVGRALLDDRNDDIAWEVLEELMARE